MRKSSIFIAVASLITSAKAFGKEFIAPFSPADQKKSAEAQAASAFDLDVIRDETECSKPRRIGWGRL